MSNALSLRMGARHVQELAAFRLCEELLKLVEAETAKPPAACDLKFCEQLNDAALDAASDVAEGFVRYYPREFARFLDYALSSLAEVRERAESGYRRRLIGPQAASDILNLCARSDRACRKLRAYLWTVRKEDLPPRPERERPQLRQRRTPRQSSEDTGDDD
jgi:four helix bundle protein